MLFEGALIVTIKEQVKIEISIFILNDLGISHKAESLYYLAQTYHRRVETMDYKNFLERLGRLYSDHWQDCSLM